EPAWQCSQWLIKSKPPPMEGGSMQPASDQVQIIAKPHPLRTDTYTCTTRAGCMLAELLEDTPETVHVQVNGEHWPRSRWHEPLPPGIVNVYAVPQGENGLRIVAMIAIAAVAAYTGGAAATW